MRGRIAAMTVMMLVLAGCTESTSDGPPATESLSADQIYDQALDNAAAQPSFHLTQTVPDARRLDVVGDATRTLVTLDLNGQRGEIRRDGLDVVARGSQGFFEAVYSPDAGDELFAAAGPGRWVRHPTTDSRYSGVKRFFDLRLLLKLFAPLTKDAPHDGTITLRDAVGATLLVSLAGSPLPTRFVRDGNQSDVSYGEPVSVTAPDPAEVVPAPAFTRG